MNTLINKIEMTYTDEINGFKVRPGNFRGNGAYIVKNAVNFTIHSHNATSCELLLFHNKEAEPYARIPFPKHFRIGKVFSMLVYDIDVSKFEYAYSFDGPYDLKQGLIFDKKNIILDPYARSVAGHRHWGERMIKGHHYTARVLKSEFEWENCKKLLTPMEDLIIYEMHVRGFTRDASSGLSEDIRGTFQGLREKIPYLKELGVTAIELMPIFEFDELADNREYEGNQLYDYWGYNTVSFFAPNTSYCAEREHNKEGDELKRLIKDLNENGMEVFLDVVFNHTAEGNERGPSFSFKGVDNNIYYMLTPEGYYYNFSGCGNTLNCNHPIVQQMILECLRYWVVEYRVDGFRFDLASILGRNEDGSPMEKPPLLQSLAFDPILGNVKLIAEAWDAGGLYQVGNFPSFKRWIEWNGKYRDEIRQFLKGDVGLARTAASRITGSKDIYDPIKRGEFASVNFITCHDGFPLYDLYAYNSKHNEKNGWNNTDGSNDNYSWNCGAEGETEDINIIKLRKKMIKNACATLMCSRGIPMFLAGDEFGNTQFGNNNVYCQDNILSWLDWNLLEENKDIFNFFKFMIRFRNTHRIVRKNTEATTMNYPQVSVHGVNPFFTNFEENNHYVGVMYAGKKDYNIKGPSNPKAIENNGNELNFQLEDEYVYIGINTYWEAQVVHLPKIPSNMIWEVIVNTNEEESICKKVYVNDNMLKIEARSVVLLKNKAL